MSQFRKMEVLLTQNLYLGLKKIASEEETDINTVINKSIERYIAGKNADNKQNLINGYNEMAQFNKDYAEMCLSADNECMALCEEKLSESE